MTLGKAFIGGFLIFALAGPGKATAATPADNAAPAVSSDAGAAPPLDRSQLYLDIIDGLIAQGRQAASLAFLDSYALAEKNPAPRYWLLRGEALLALSQPAEAADAFARLEGTALVGAGWNGRGRVAAAQANWPQAAGDFEKAVASEPANADFLNNLAFAQLRAGEGSRSVTSLRQARELKPQSELIRNNLIIALTVSGDEEAAGRLLASIADPERRRQAQALVRQAIEKDQLIRKDGS